MTTLSNRRTIVAHGRLAMRELRLDAARQRRHGVQIMSFEQLAVRLAGGFARPIDDECLRTAIQAVLPCISCYAKTCSNPDTHACMKAITPEWLAAQLPNLIAGDLKAGQDLPGSLRSF